MVKRRLVWSSGSHHSQRLVASGPDEGSIQGRGQEWTKCCRRGSSPMSGHGPVCGLSRWPWASSGTAHSVPLCLAQRTAKSAPRQGVGVDVEPVPNRPRQVWVDSGVASYAGTQWILTGICCYHAQI